MRNVLLKYSYAIVKIISLCLGVATSVVLLCMVSSRPGKISNRIPVVETHQLLLPGPLSQAIGLPNNQSAAIAASSATPSAHWIINGHGQCCEGNLAAQGQSTYVLLPILVTGNQIWRSDNGGVSWTQKYPPVNASIPYGIEGDLEAFGNDIVFFGTEVGAGICAHSSDRGESWTAVQIPVASAGNDQAWSYLGPFANMRPGAPLPTDAPYVLTGWYRIGSVALFSFDGGLTWPIQTPLVGDDGSGPDHIVCEETATAPTSPGDTRIPDVNFINHKSGRHGAWGTDKKFYWTQTSNGTVGPAGNLYVCSTNNFGATWTGVVHPIVGGDTTDVLTYAGFDNKGTFYVLHGDRLYVSFNQGQDFAYVHQLPIFPNGEGADGANAFFVVNCGTIHIGLAQSGSSVNNIWYLRGTNVDTANPTWDQELVDVVGLNRLDFMQVILNGNNIPTISYTDGAGAVVTASRDAPMSGGSPCLPCLASSGAVSRKTHGSAGTFDIPLPLTGSPGIECRSGGANGDHQIVFSFCNAVSIGSVTSSCATVANNSTSGNQVTVNLTGVPNGQCCSVTLHGVNDGTTIGDVTVPICYLLGDVNANRVVSNTDVSLVKAQVTAAVDSTNFREDVNANGVISNTDVSLTKAQVGTTLP
jgi:hypothetical protein